MATLTTRRDLTTRADLHALLTRFYGQALVDDVLAEPFTDVREKGLEAHLPVMCDFWETMLFNAGSYTGSAMRVHLHVQESHPMTDQHFIRWLMLWDATVDAMFSGPVADQAKAQAGRIAWAMSRRLTGSESAELDALLGRE